MTSVVFLPHITFELLSYLWESYKKVDCFVENR